MSKPQSQLNNIAAAIVHESKTLSKDECEKLGDLLQKQVERIIREQKVAQSDLKDMERGLDLASLYNEIGGNIIILRMQAEDLRLKHRELEEALEQAGNARAQGSVKKEQEKVEGEHDQVMAQLEEFELKQAEIKPALVKTLSGFRFKNLDAIKTVCQQTKIKLVQLDQKLAQLQAELKASVSDGSQKTASNINNFSITIDTTEQASLIAQRASEKV